MFLNDNSEVSKIFKEYFYVFVSVGDLRVGDVEGLLNDYKQFVFKYVCFFKGLGDVIIFLVVLSLVL